MLDENLPTFLYQASDSPLSTVLYYTHLGSAPQPAHLLRRPEPSSSRNVYALALADAGYPDVIFGEIVVRPDLAQPSLSASEIRAQNAAALQRAGTSSPPRDGLLPVIPDTVVLRLYNPDQNIGIRMFPGGWSRTDAWEFEMPEHSFKTPSASKIDQAEGSSRDEVVDFAPKIVFKWKKDSKLGRDMTCYMTGKSVAGRKSKEPDITIAMYKAGKHESVTIYEPNLQRVEVQDRKGLEIVLLLGAAVIRDLWLNPRNDPFNAAVPAATSPKIPAAAAAAAAATADSPANAAMSGAMPVASSAPTAAAAAAPSSSSSSSAAAVPMDAETRRLKQEVEAEAQRQTRERERRDREEQNRIRKMLEREERERRRRDDEVEAETEKLRRMYGTNGQDFPGTSSPVPIPPPRPGGATPAAAGWRLARVTNSPQTTGPPQVHFAPGSVPAESSPSNSGHSRWWSRDSLGLAYNNAGAAASSLFFREDGKTNKLAKKKSMQW